MMTLVGCGGTVPATEGRERRMTDPIAVRPATTADLAGVRDVATQSWRAAYAGLIPDADVERFLADAYSAAALEQTLRALGPGFLVAADGDDVVGYAKSGRNREGGAELFAIYVLPERQGAGIGRRLWSAVVEHLRGLGFAGLAVWVLAGNGQARRFYERQGARRVAEREFPVGDGVVPEVGYRASLAP